MKMIICLILTFLAGFEAKVDSDEITDLPGLTFKPNFKSYSGYLKASGSKKLHYWLVTSQTGNVSDPLVLWLNGGPGCSSMDGLLSEHGPYLVSSDGKTLKENPYSWNKIAHVLYLESPAGVGYSYSDDKDYKTDDDQVSLDNYLAIQDFFKAFPEYSKNEFYITGESYGGIYVPTLSARIVDDQSINFKGLAVGNGALDFSLLDTSIIAFGYAHGLWGNSLMLELINNCCKNGNASDCNYYNNPNIKCQQAIMAAHEIIGSVNIYNLYAMCYQTPTTSLPGNKSFVVSSNNLMFTKNGLIQGKKNNQLKNTPPHKVGVVPPCIDASGLIKYLNDPAVRKAIHIPADLPDWEICSGVVGSQYGRLYENVRPQVLKVLSSEKQRVLVYNGDIDMACNFLGDEWFVDSLGQSLVKSRDEWMYVAADGSKQVAGWIKQFKNLNFVTIRGAGHMVPQDKPIPSFDMFRRFIKGEPY